ncbi:DivIVA domain-containing protein [Micromonospora pattaloongensis]|uniref:DivIVA domain-containing protein n=2 Tax=Micromonospora pattaloongensis TaxID=405436 RepID=A0A1H3QVY1_9ACTN|nr:DivIVA domain-containing protein [Micromonospora pattaloongensis]SDZ17500.1 DivIVA domain-containing protein [Micromonospora pattaloongensis]
MLLSPRHVREREFAVTRLGRRGLDPHDVRTFLDRVAVDLGALQAEVVRVRRENERIKRALRDWQSMHARRCQGGAADQPRHGGPGANERAW